MKKFIQNLKQRCKVNNRNPMKLIGIVSILAWVLVFVSMVVNAINAALYISLAKDTQISLMAIWIINNILLITPLICIVIYIYKLHKAIKNNDFVVYEAAELGE